MRLTNLVFLILFTIILNYSCDSNKSTDEIKEIHNIAIDNTVVPLPPPPPPKPGEKPGIPQQVLDSINAIKLKIAVSNIIDLHDKKSFNISNYQNYNEAEKNLIGNKNQTLDKKNWSTNKGHDISVINFQEVDKKELFKNYNALVSFSNVGFNSAKDKAVVIIGVSYGAKLSGTVILYLMEKVNSIWKIKHERTISIA